MRLFRRRELPTPVTPRMWPTIGYDISDGEWFAYLIGAYDRERPPWMDRPRPEQEGQR